MFKYLTTYIFTLCLFSTLNGQYYEQAYSYINEGKGTLNKMVELPNGNILAVGNYENIGAVLILQQDGLMIGSVEYSRINVVFTDIIKNPTGSDYYLGGICKDCIEIGKSHGIIVQMIANAAGFTFGKEYLFLTPQGNSITTTVKLAIHNQSIYAVGQGEILNFGTRPFLFKLTLNSLTKVSERLFNVSFFSEPNYIKIIDDHVYIGVIGFEKNILIKADTNGVEKNLTLLPFGKSAFVGFGNGIFAMAYYKNNSQILKLFHETSTLSDSIIIDTGTPLNNDFDITLTPNGDILLTSPYLDIAQLPYINFYDRVVKVNPLTIKTIPPIYFNIPANGTVNRNINCILGGTNLNDFKIVGTRKEEANRLCFINHTASSIPIQPPLTWHGKDVCNDTNLIDKKKQLLWPSVLPHITNDVIYATKKNFKGVDENLWMDIYRPYDHYAKKSSDLRPALINFNGGGYNFMTENYSTPLLHAVESGMIGVSVKYRTGIHPNYDGNIDSALAFAPFFLKASYRALQDARDALAFIDQHADEWNIDRTKIFLMGHSAGGNIVLNYIHLNEGDIHQPTVNELGGLKPRIPIAGVIPYAAPLNSMSFSVINSLEYIDNEEDMPTFFIHGTCDSLAYYTNGNSIDQGSKANQGAYNIVCKKQSLGHPYRLATIIGGEHDMGIYESDIMKSVFSWMEDEVICGTSKQSCETYGLVNNLSCANISTCPTCVNSTFNQTQENILIYPTITDDLIYLKTNDVDVKHVLISNSIGKIVSKIDDMMMPVEISLASLEPGIYFVSCYTKGRISTFKIVKI